MKKIEIVKDAYCYNGLETNFKIHFEKELIEKILISEIRVNATQDRGDILRFLISFYYLQIQ